MADIVEPRLDPLLHTERANVSLHEADEELDEVNFIGFYRSNVIIF